MTARRFPLFGVFLIMAGCSTITPEEQRAADEAECRSYGFVSRNDAFAECLQRIALDRRAARRADNHFSDPWISMPPQVVVVERRVN